jgi:hypothetical protein
MLIYEIFTIMTSYLQLDVMDGPLKQRIGTVDNVKVDGHQQT